MIKLSPAGRHTNPWLHPHPSAEHVRDMYRTHLVELKRKWMGMGRGHRCLRGLIHYRAMIDTYLAAKRFTLK